ncbi:scavenger receptor cysteine-rich domain-containing protein DMBT1-like [Cetorhinus maximus]
MYHCSVLINSFKHTAQSVQITVKSGIVTPRLTKHPPWERFLTGDRIILKCEVGKTPGSINYFWNINGQGDITGSESYIIEAAALNYTGVYKCKINTTTSTLHTAYSNTIRLSITDPIEMRLVNGTETCSGRLELNYNNTWGSVCGAGWDMLDAKVACQQLGCGVAKSAPQGGHFGAAPGLFWLDDVACKGTEANLFQCRANAWGKHNCTSAEAASVICSGQYYVEGLIRLCLSVVLLVLAVILIATQLKINHRSKRSNLGNIRVN